MGRHRSSIRRPTRGGSARKEPPKGLYDVPGPESKEWPQEWYCLNVMCRAKYWREHGESEFCPSCRKCVGGGR